MDKEGSIVEPELEPGTGTEYGSGAGVPKWIQFRPVPVPAPQPWKVELSGLQLSQESLKNA